LLAELFGARAASFAEDLRVNPSREAAAAAAAAAAATTATVGHVAGVGVSEEPQRFLGEGLPQRLPDAVYYEQGGGAAGAGGDSASLEELVLEADALIFGLFNYDREPTREPAAS
jgi:hypothetical protein